MFVQCRGVLNVDERMRKRLLIFRILIILSHHSGLISFSFYGAFDAVCGNLPSNRMTVWKKCAAFCSFSRSHFLSTHVNKNRQSIVLVFRQLELTFLWTDWGFGRTFPIEIDWENERRKNDEACDFFPHTHTHTSWPSMKTTVAHLNMGLKAFIYRSTLGMCVQCTLSFCMIFKLWLFVFDPVRFEKLWFGQCALFLVRRFALCCNVMCFCNFEQLSFCLLLCYLFKMNSIRCHQALIFLSWSLFFLLFIFPIGFRHPVHILYICILVLDIFISFHIIFLLCRSVTFLWVSNPFSYNIYSIKYGIEYVFKVHAHE